MQRFFKFFTFMFYTFLLFSQVSAQNWMKVQEIDTTTVYTIISHNGSLYVHTEDEIFTSADGGSSWQPIASYP